MVWEMLLTGSCGESRPRAPPQREKGMAGPASESDTGGEHVHTVQEKNEVPSSKGKGAAK
jgi:hypothetical protein